MVQRYSSITEFFNRLQKCLDSLSDERDQRATNLVQKRPVSYESMSIEEKEYLQHLTPYAFGYVKQRLSLKTKVKEFENQGNGSFTVNSTQGMISTSSTNCECCFHTAMKLPCRHIFALSRGGSRGWRRSLKPRSEFQDVLFFRQPIKERYLILSKSPPQLSSVGSNLKSDHLSHSTQ